MKNWVNETDKKIINAINNKKWIEINYHDNSKITIKPIIYGRSSYGDDFVFAWGWHSGKPGYYRFDIDKITEIFPEQDLEDPIEKDYQSFYSKPTWVEDYFAFRDDYKF